MKKSTKSIIISSALLIVGCMIFLFMYDFPKKIDTTVPAIEFRLGDNKSIEQTTITINGRLKRPLFRTRIFEGQISIEKYPKTSEWKLNDPIPIFSSNNETYFSGLYYLKKNALFNFIFASFWTNKSFEQFNIYVFPDDNENNNENPRFISAPASTYEEAVKIYETLVDHREE